MNGDDLEDGYLQKSEVDRRDLTHTAAIVISLPDLSGSQYVSDRSRSAALSQAFAYGDDSKATREQFTKLVALDVQEAAASIPQQYLMPSIEARPYHIGPHAQGWPLYLVRFIEDARPILEDAALLWALGQAAQTIIRKARTWPGAELRRHDGAPVSLSEPMLQSLAYAHAFNMYSLEGTVKLKSSYRAPFAGYGEPEHFGGQETYLIQVGSGKSPTATW